MNGPDRGLFDVWSYFYDLPLMQRITYRPVHDAVMWELRRRRPRALLDVGCGTGQLARRIASELPRTRVVACDFSAGMLSRAGRGDGAASVARVNASASELPFAAESFDAVVSTEAFHWFPDQRSALAEMRRVLVPGGRLLLEVIHPPFEFLGDLMLRASSLAGEPFYWPTCERMQRRLEDAGFRVAEQRRISRWVGGPLFPGYLNVARRARSRPTPAKG